MNQIIIVVAISANNAIGKNNELLWHMPNDLKHFKNITSGGTVVMGRKTFDSVGRPLPNRRNIVITRQKDLQIDGVEVVNSLNSALELTSNEEKIFILGGAEIYKEALPLTHKIELTRVHQEFDADAFFPELDNETWKEVWKEDHLPDEKNKFAYTFSTLERR
ncbi:dihydrofolate reductase [Pedobacter sp.]